VPSFWSCNMLSNNIILVYISLYKQAACIYLLAIMHSLFLVLHGLFLTALHDLTVHNKIHSLVKKGFLFPAANPLYFRLRSREQEFGNKGLVAENRSGPLVPVGDTNRD